MTTHFLKDILRQPVVLQGALERLTGPDRNKLDDAAAAIRAARHVFLTGIGASWHAALSVGVLLDLAGFPVYLRDASELLHFAEIPADSAIVVLSRSGQSIEVVRLLEKARASGAAVIGITNAQDGALARGAKIAVVVPTERDYGISVNTYSTLGLAAGLVAAGVAKKTDFALISSLSNALKLSANSLQEWQGQIKDSRWFKTAVSYYFLGRGASNGTCNEARLLWEEGVKHPASAISTGNFRHGPQEISRQGLRVGMWIDAALMREEDLAVANDLRKLGVSVMLVGQHVPADSAELVFQLPQIPAEWQFLIEAMPVQLAAEYFSRISGADSDSFRVCSYVVEGESGLLAENQPLPKD